MGVVSGEGGFYFMNDERFDLWLKQRFSWEYKWHCYKAGRNTWTMKTTIDCYEAIKYVLLKPGTTSIIKHNLTLPELTDFITNHLKPTTT